MSRIFWSCQVADVLVGCLRRGRRWLLWSFSNFVQRNKPDGRGFFRDRAAAAAAAAAAATTVMLCCLVLPLLYWLFPVSFAPVPLSPFPRAWLCLVYVCTIVFGFLCDTMR